MNFQPPTPSDRQSPSADEPTLDVTCDYVGSGAAEQLVRVLDQYLDDLKAGKQPDREAFIAQHPQLASQLEACLAGLDFIHGTEQVPPERLQRLGDYRLIREVGRGGMGAVFEAEQVSLARRVALKVLRFGGVSDPEALERFQREAETVAKLHHTNIVPIFAVGCEKGVNFFAMQFIEGRSLAQVLSDRQAPLAPKEVAEIGLQAAEALAHAHQRGVVHRDVKPSNLLLDDENRVWLTDFGLARSLDDVTLSLTGALLGTPRYMSPEQATASTKRVDHRSDLFSLGATLYELLLARPAFTGDNPHDVIQHILSDEPVPLRSIDPNIPRDLETMVMKCLAKDPQHRYAAARELAEDLRAYLDGRPIKARRANAVELASRWVKRNQRSTTLVTSAAAITILVTVLGSLGQAQYNAWRQASVQLSAVRPPLVAEIMDSDGILKRVDTLPMQKPVSLIADEYQVRLSADGRLSQTYTMDLQRGSTYQAPTTLDNQHLFPPQSLDRTFDVVDLGAESAIVLWNEDHVALRKSSGPEFEWKRELNKELAPFNASPGFEWPWSSPILQYSGYGTYHYQPLVVQSFIDVNQDGVGDLIAAAQHQSWLMAVSGADGSLLWFAPRGEQLASTKSHLPASYTNAYRSAVLGEPLLTADLDEDKVPELIVTMLDVPTASSMQGQALKCDRWIEAISGATGKTVWRYELPSELFDLPTPAEVPYDLRWFVGGAAGMSSGGRNSVLVGKHISRTPGHQERNGMHAYRPTPAELISFAGSDRIACIAGTHIVQLDPQKGREIEPPIDVGVRVGKAPQWADVDGDGSSELILLEEIPTTGYPQIPLAKLHVWSTVKREMLWSLSLDADWPRQPSWTVEAPHWPLVVDLQSDGTREILVPHHRSTYSRPAGPVPVDSMPWGEVLLLEGSTGRELWSRRMISIDSQVDCFIAGPDLNDDGTKEIFFATLADRNINVYVDALSGEDGSSCWTASFEPRNTNDMSTGLVLGNLNWCNAGPDGWPQLIVPLNNDQGPTNQSLLCLFSAGTSEVTHFGYGFTSGRPADLDRDGLEELLLFSSRSSSRGDFGGVLSCMRGIDRQPWKRFGDPGQPICDIDQDGVSDFVRSLGDGTLLASSGATGKRLWQNRPVHAVDTLTIIAATRGDRSQEKHSVAPERVDFDGDGVGDLLACEPSSGGRGLISPFNAISGKTGRLLWTMSDVNARLTNSIAVACDDFDNDGSIEVAWLAALDHNFPARFGFASNDAQLWLFVASGRTGKLLWSRPLSPAYGHSLGNSSPFQFQRVDLALAIGDLNRDGYRDLVTPAIDKAGSLELRALSGRNGETLWTRDRNLDGLSQESLRNWTPPTICDLDGDGQLEVASIEPAPIHSSGGVNQPQVQISLLSGFDGEAVWTHVTDAPFTHFRSFSNRTGNLLRPLAIRAGTDQQRIGVLLLGGNSKFALLDQDGNYVERALKTPDHLGDVWVCDEISPGVDGLAFIENNALIVVSANDLDQLIWRRQFATSAGLTILSAEPHGCIGSPMIVVTTGATDNSVLGIDATSGITIWSCPGPIIRDADDGVYITPQRITWLSNRAGHAPLVAYSLQHESECRQAVMHTRDSDAAGVGSYAASGIDFVPALIEPAAIDARWQRSLPWVANLEYSYGPMIPFILGGFFFSLAFVVLPIAYAAISIKRRQFGLRGLLGLPLVFGFMMLAASMTAPVENDFRTTSSRLMIGILFAPIIFAAFLWLRSLLTKRYLLTVFWIAIVCGVSLLLATMQLGSSLSRSPLLPQESIDWTGWYHILWIGGYVTAWIMTSTFLISWLGRTIYRLAFRFRPPLEL
jgi:serine/threonine protein kinase/outer membrane protein assembly factor BamB